jgi:exopolyphosphatase/guanosine-5'-triphosphate,3'-diphosphate pyrophosphatase
VYLRLGDDAYARGRIGRRKLENLREVADRYAHSARAARVERLETIVTAPGRQAVNGDELVEVVRAATDAPVILLTAEGEGRLAWTGAVSFLEEPPAAVAVVDLGGGSCEIAVGRPEDGPSWVRSREAGGLRVTRALLSERPRKRDLRAARRAVHEFFEDVDPPRADLALAVGGTARAVARVLGSSYDAVELDALADRLVRKGPEAVMGLDITPGRLETLLGGTLVLAEVSRRLGEGLVLGRGGLREGAALALGRAEAVAA